MIGAARLVGPGASFITRRVSALEAHASRVRDGADVAPADLRDSAQALRVYAHELHREKEEHVLLPLLVRDGFDWRRFDERPTHIARRAVVTDIGETLIGRYSALDATQH